MRDPGAGFGYSNLTSQLLGIVLQRACKTDLLSFARKNLFGPMDAEIADWTVGPDGYTSSAGEALRAGARHGAARPALSSTAEVYMGEQIVPADWVKASLTSYTKDAWTTPKLGRFFRDIGYGYQWWSAKAGGHDRLRLGSWRAAHRALHDLDMVIVTTADPQIGIDPIREPGWEHELAIINLVGRFVTALPSGKAGGTN